MTVKPNDLIAGYHFVQKLGEGATGTVWLGREKDSHLLVAIKLIRAERFPPSSGQALYERLVQAITQIGRLTHPNLVQTRATFHQPRAGLFGIVSEYLEGQTLDGIYIPKGVDGRPGASDSRTMAGVLAWFQQVATVLAWLHANGVVHGNVRPKNVMLMTGYERPTIKLLDLCWSAARLKEGAPDDPRSIAPELLAGAEPSPASDQWACGKLLHQLLVSSAPPGSQTQALATAPVNLLKVVQRALQKEPKDRFPDTGAFFYALESVRNELERDAGVSASWEVAKRVSPTAQMESVKRPASLDPTEPVTLPPPPLPMPTAAPVAVERAVERSVEREVERRGPTDEMFVASDPPLIPPPLPAKPVRRPVMREETEAVEAYDEVDDERPPRNWGAIGGLALLLAIGIAGGAFFLTRGPEIPISERPAGGSGGVTSRPIEGALDAGAGAAGKSAGDKVGATAGGEKAAAENGSADKAAADKGAGEKAVAERIAAEKGAAGKTPAENAAAEKASAEKAAAEKAAAEKAVAEKAAAEKASAERAAAEKGAARKTSAENTAAEKAAAERAAAAKSSAEKAVAEKAATEQRSGSGSGPGPGEELAELDADCQSKKLAPACQELGDRHASGKGTAKDPLKAAAAYERACDLGRLNACSRAGDLYVRDGGAASTKSARRVLEKACDRQVATACAELARLYRDGIGGPPNDRLAKAFTRRACGFGLQSSCEK